MPDKSNTQKESIQHTQITTQHTRKKHGKQNTQT